MKKKGKLNGQLKLYMQWPVIMIILLVIMSVWMYIIDLTAGLVMSFFVIVYIIVACILYFYNREILLGDLVQFANYYGNVQSQLLKDLDSPYILLQEDGRILWSNTMFDTIVTEHNFRDKYISKLIPSLNKSVFPKDVDQQIFKEINWVDREYTVSLKKIKVESYAESFKEIEKNSYIISATFRDDTDLNQYIEDRDNQQLIAGLLYIDNYDEVLDGVEEVRQPLLIALVERKINQYFSNVDAIIKKMEKDKFFLVIKRKHFKIIEQDRFSLLEDVKTVSIFGEGTVSLSIGLGLSGETYSQSYNYARVAIDLALARGGDQAVFKQPNGIVYFGGKREQIMKNTRVKARVKAEALREFIVTKDHVIVVGHRMADVDSFGAAVGIYRACQALEKKAYIVINEITTSVRPLYEGFLNNSEYSSDLFLTSAEVSSYITDNTMVVVVDTNKPSMCDCPELLKKAKTIAVLDHHRQESTSIDNAVLSYIEPYASSACEMVAEVLQYIADDVKLRGIEADSMYAGIVIDTNNFMNRTGVRTFEAAAFLRRHGADVTRVRKLFRDDFDSCQAKAESICQAEVLYEKYAFAVCISHGIKSPTILGAQIANELLDINGIQASFVFTEYNGSIYVSARAIDEVNVQIITEKLGGGGHINVAGVQFSNITIKEAQSKVKSIIEEMIEKGDL